MLKIFFGSPPEECVYDTRTYFDRVYEGEWITSDLARKMIKDVDQSDVVSENIIESPILGAITPRQLSGGVKTLLLCLNEPETMFNISTCGNNCAKWLLEIGKRTDVTVRLGYPMEFGDGEFEIFCVNTGTVIHNMSEYVNTVLDFI